MRSTFKVLFYLKRDKQKANGNVPLFCRITIDGSEVRFGMKKEVHPRFWDVKAGKATGRTNEAVEINALIDTTKSAIHRVYRELLERENNVTAEKVKNAFLGINTSRHNLLEVFDEHNREKKRLVGVSITMAMYDKYRLTRDHLEQFLHEWYNLSDISLKEIDYKFINGFEVFLLTTRKCSANTAASYLKLFKHLVMVAIKFGWMYKDPFSDYPIRLEKVDRGYLTQEEIEILMRQTFQLKRLERVRDLFVFCCFSGLSFIDVKNFTKENIRTSFDGNLWIIGKRGKTDVTYTVPLLDIPKMILEKYKGKLPEGRLLPLVNNCNANAYLKEIAILSGIKKKLTFHMSRHSFATLTLSKGVSIESVSKMLGHTDIKTTQIYARITAEKIGNDMALFAGKVKGMESNFAVNLQDKQ
jgi:site-specific recombinase XerD